MSTGNGGQSEFRYPAGLPGPKCLSLVFCTDLKPMVHLAIADNSYLVENNFYGSSTNAATASGGIEVVAAQFRMTGHYRTHDAALRTLYRVLNEQPICGAHIADALALACDTTLHTEDIREYPRNQKAALEIVFTAADEAGEILTPFDLQERATALWHETYDRYVVEMEPFKEKYEAARVARRGHRRVRRPVGTLA